MEGGREELKMARTDRGRKKGERRIREGGIRGGVIREVRKEEGKGQRGESNQRDSNRRSREMRGSSASKIDLQTSRRSWKRAGEAGMRAGKARQDSEQ